MLHIVIASIQFVGAAAAVVLAVTEKTTKDRIVYLLNAGVAAVSGLAILGII